MGGGDEKNLQKNQRRWEEVAKKIIGGGTNDIISKQFQRQKDKQIGFLKQNLHLHKWLTLHFLTKNFRIAILVSDLDRVRLAWRVVPPGVGAERKDGEPPLSIGRSHILRDGRPEVQSCSCFRGCHVLSSPPSPVDATSAPRAWD